MVDSLVVTTDLVSTGLRVKLVVALLLFIVLILSPVSVHALAQLHGILDRDTCPVLGTLFVVTLIVGLKYAWNDTTLVVPRGTTSYP